MTIAELEIKEWGNSLGLIIPKDITKEESLQEGDRVRIEVHKLKRLDGFGLFRGANPFERDEEDHGEFR